MYAEKERDRPQFRRVLEPPRGAPEFLHEETTMKLPVYREKRAHDAVTRVVAPPRWLLAAEAAGGTSVSEYDPELTEPDLFIELDLPQSDKTVVSPSPFTATEQTEEEVMRFGIDESAVPESPVAEERERHDTIPTPLSYPTYEPQIADLAAEALGSTEEDYTLAAILDFIGEGWEEEPAPPFSMLEPASRRWPMLFIAVSLLLMAVGVAYALLGDRWSVM
jgi:hypothetical protein